MGSMEQNIIRSLKQNPGQSDREVAQAISGHSESARYVNQKCRALAARKIISRAKRRDGLIGNWLQPDPVQPDGSGACGADADELSEKRMKKILEAYLTERKWEIKVNRGNRHGIDIEACHGQARWIIEVKGAGDYSPMRASYFFSVLGEILKRMDDPGCKYSIALPEITQFCRLWERLPVLAKKRTGVTALFVDSAGNVTEKAE
jgi:hypothetical protein